MSDGSLSQDEIDALLQGTEGAEPEPGGAEQPASGGGAFSDQERQTFLDLVNSFKDAQASNLSGLMVSKSVTIGTPEVSYLDAEGFVGAHPGDIISVRLDFSEGLTGGHGFILSEDTAVSVAGNIVGQEDLELNDMALEALKEAFSTITGVALTTIGDKIGATIMPSPGESEKTTADGVPIPPSGVVQVAYPVTVEGENSHTIYEIYDADLAKAITLKLSPTPSAGVQGQAAGMDFGLGGDMTGQEGPAASGFNMQPGGQMGGMQMMGPGGGPNVQQVQFPNLTPSTGGQDTGNISLLMDVYMEMTVELGRTKKPIREILGMGEGTIIELDKLAGEPVDILVNHKLIATGEVVVIDENFGVRVTEIVSPTERMKDIT